MKTPDITGKTFGQLTVLTRLPNEKSRSSWYCACSCGGFKITNNKALQEGNTSSCGCVRTIHGLSGTPLHKVWTSMRERCSNPKAKSYMHYGARGIRVCERWNNFESFLKDMGARPEGCSIERRNNNGNYEPSNCYWATDLQQAQNTTRTRLLTAGGRTMCISAWVRELGGESTLILNRLKYGWTEEEACLIPKGQKRKCYHK